jgi:hypothetical protein
MADSENLPESKSKREGTYFSDYKFPIQGWVNLNHDDGVQSTRFTLRDRIIHTY